MIRTSHEFVTTDDGVMETYVARPDSDTPAPGVILYQNASGLSDGLMWCARRYAEHGFYCAAPNLYYRLGQLNIDPDDQSEDGIKIRMLRLQHAMVPFRAIEDTKPLMEF